MLNSPVIEDPWHSYRNDELHGCTALRYVNPFCAFQKVARGRFGWFRCGRSWDNSRCPRTFLGWCRATVSTESAPSCPSFSVSERPRLVRSGWFGESRSGSGSAARRSLSRSAGPAAPPESGPPGRGFEPRTECGSDSAAPPARSFRPSSSGAPSGRALSL